MNDPLYRPAELTEATVEDLCMSAYHVWKQYYGHPPDVDPLACMLSQIALETGHMKECRCWNVGNIKRRHGSDDLWTMFRCGEMVKGKLIMYDPPHSETHFMAFEDLDDGIHFYLRFLALSDRYEHAWRALKEGDPELFARELGEAGYYTAEIGKYTSSVIKLFDQYRLIVMDRIEPELLSQAELQQLEGLEMMSLDHMARGLFIEPAAC